MKRTVLVLIVCLGFSITFAAVHEKDFGNILGPLSKVWHKKCVPITGVRKEQIEEMNQGVFSNNENTKRYVLCLFLVSEAMTTEFIFDDRMVKYYLPNHLKYKVSHYRDCLNDAKKSGETEIVEQAWTTIECVYNKDPENFIMF